MHQASNSFIPFNNTRLCSSKRALSGLRGKRKFQRLVPASFSPALAGLVRSFDPRLLLLLDELFVKLDAKAEASPAFFFSLKTLKALLALKEFNKS